MVGVTAAEVRAEPARFVGQTVEWRLQVIAVKQADELRSEMPPGQPYLLTRGPLPEPGFVYVTIPAARAAEFQALPPLQEAGAPRRHPGGPHQVSHDAGRGAGVGGLGHGRKVGVPMNDLLKQRIGRLLDALSDERGYQILDYIEFLDSKYAERARPGGILAKITETVEDTMRAGKLPIQAISGTMGIMDSAAKVMKGLAAAGQAVVDEAVKAAESALQARARAAEPPTGVQHRKLTRARRQLEPHAGPAPAARRPTSFPSYAMATTTEAPADHVRRRRNSSAASARSRRSRWSSAR